MAFRLRLPEPLSTRRFAAWALLLSAAAHLGLFLAFDGAAVTVAAPTSQTPAATLTVELKPADSAPERTVLASSPTTSGSQAARTPQPVPAVVNPPRPHYLEAGEWTDAPALVQDIAADQMLVSPRLTASPLRITLFINEQGRVDKLAIDAPSLPEFETQLVHAAFAEVRFEPARLRGLAVKSSLTIELKLENSRSEPAPG